MDICRDGTESCEEATKFFFKKKINECMDILAFIFQHCSFKQKHINKPELVGSRGMDWEEERLYFSRNTDYT